MQDGHDTKRAPDLGNFCIAQLRDALDVRAFPGVHLDGVHACREGHERCWLLLVYGAQVTLMNPAGTPLALIPAASMTATLIKYHLIALTLELTGDDLAGQLHAAIGARHLLLSDPRLRPRHHSGRRHLSAVNKSVRQHMFRLCCDEAHKGSPSV